MIDHYNKPENQDEDALGKIEQQQALSFWNCSQHEWEPQMMSKEKGDLNQSGYSNAQKGSNRIPGYQELRGTLKMCRHILKMCRHN